MGSRYNNYLLAVLTAIVTFNYVDRIALGVVLQSIGADLAVTDTQLGFLSGLAFALFYAVMGVPIARLADRGNRVTLLASTTALWSVAIGLCGLARSFAQLLLIRVAVAVGEAGSVPASLSMISDCFSRGERPRAAAIYGTGAGWCSIVGYLLAGYLNEHYGWRSTFLVLSIPGLILSLLAWKTLKEPRLSADPRTRKAPLGDEVPPSFARGFVSLWRTKTFRYLLMWIVLIYLFGYGIQQWQATYLIRTFGLSTGQVGLCLALVYGTGGLLGSYVGGELSWRYAAHREGLQLKAIAVAISATGLFFAMAFLSRSLYLTYCFLGAANFMFMSANGPGLSAVMGVVPERLRSFALAVILFMANLVGLGLGPLAAGALSDALRSTAGNDSLRYALVILTPGFIAAAWYALKASAVVHDDLVLDHVDLVTSRS